MASFTGDMYISDTDILKLSVNDAMQILHTDEYPWATFLGLSEPKFSGYDAKDHWLNSAEGLVKTAINMSSGMTGGASETITVDSTANLVADNTIVIAENGALDPQIARISKIDSSTTMTIYPLSGTLSTHADNTVIILGGDWVKYGTTVDQPLRLPTRDSNTMEQISVSKDVPYIVKRARMLNGENVEANLQRMALDVFKQKITIATIFGEEVEASAGSHEAKMDGLINLIPGANDETAGTWDRAHIRVFVGDLRKRGAFPNARGLIVCNSEALTDMYAFDDSTTGVSVRTLDRPLNELIIRGVTFRVMEELAMTDGFIANKARAFFLTPDYKGKKLCRLAICQDPDANGMLKKVLRTAVQTTDQVAAFATMELIDPRRHGFFQEA